MAISSIGSNSRDYVDIDAWLADLPATLTEQERAECYNDSEFAYSGTMTISGIATTPTNNLVITAAAGESFADNDTNHLRYDASQGVGFRRTNPYGLAIDLRTNHTLLERIQIATTGSQNSRPISVNSNSSTINRCLIRTGGNSYTLRFQTQNSAVINSVILQEGSGQGIQANYAAPTIINNTIVKIGSTSSTGIDKAGGQSFNTVVINNALFNWSTPMESGSYGAGSDYNATDASSLPVGTNNLTSLTFADQFENVTSGSVDLRLKSGNSLDGAASVRSETGGVDIFGNTRSGTTPSIGAFETASSAPIVREGTGDFDSQNSTLTGVGQQISPVNSGTGSLASAAALMTGVGQRITTEPVQIGGIDITGTPAFNTFAGGGTLPGQDFIQTQCQIHTAGSLTRFSVRMDGPQPASATLKLKIWRIVGSNFVFIGESQSFSNLASGINTNLNLTTPFDVQVGDMIGLFLSQGTGNRVHSFEDPSGAIAFKVADDTTDQPTGTYTISPVNKCLAVEVFGLTGDTPNTGTGSLESEDSTISGTGVRVSTGTGSLVSNDSTISGVGDGFTVNEGTGSLLTDDALLSGVGSQAGVITGTGSLTSSNVEVSGSGVRVAVGTGDLTSPNSALSGSGLQFTVNTGSGDLEASAVQLNGSGLGFTVITGTGTLESNGSQLNGTGIRVSVGTGDLVSDDSDLDGVGQMIPAGGTIVGSGNFVVSDSTMSGVGIKISVGTGALNVSDAELDGVGEQGGVIVGTGDLQSDDSQLEGLGVRFTVRSGTGDLVSAQAEMNGVGVRISPTEGTGSLESDDAEMEGVGQRIRIIAGTGNLESGNSILIGNDTTPVIINVVNLEGSYSTLANLQGSK